MPVAKSQARTKAPRKESQRLRVATIERAAAIMRSLQRHARPMSLGELAKDIAAPRAAVQRLVDALDREGLVLAASETGGVRLGPALKPLAAAAQFSVVDLLHPFLLQLANTSGETIVLTLYNRGKLTFIDHIEGHQRLRAGIVEIGASWPLHCSADGKAMLAALTDEELAEVRKDLKFPQLTEHTVKSWDGLMRHIRQIREVGVAVDREEHSHGISAVGVALRGPDRELLAISMPTPSQRFETSQDQLTMQLQQCVRQIVTRLKLKP